MNCKFIQWPRFPRRRREPGRHYFNNFSHLATENFAGLSARRNGIFSGFYPCSQSVSIPFEIRYARMLLRIFSDPSFGFFRCPFRANSFEPWQRQPPFVGFFDDSNEPLVKFASGRLPLFSQFPIRHGKSNPRNLDWTPSPFPLLAGDIVNLWGNLLPVYASFLLSFLPAWPQIIRKLPFPELAKIMFRSLDHERSFARGRNETVRRIIEDGHTGKSNLSIGMYKRNKRCAGNLPRFSILSTSRVPSERRPNFTISKPVVLSEPLFF